jgi:hypothetical protein
MKTKTIFLTVFMVLSTIGITFAQAANTASESGINAFSFTEYLLMTVCLIMLAVIWIMSRTIKSLSEQMR